jgi:hypothetical protein
MVPLGLDINRLPLAFGAGDTDEQERAARHH